MKTFTMPNGDQVTLPDRADVRVYLVQRALNLLGQSPQLVEDGLHGPATEAALRATSASTH